jgi:hypothetical protein
MENEVSWYKSKSRSRRDAVHEKERGSRDVTARRGNPK